MKVKDALTHIRTYLHLDDGNKDMALYVSSENLWLKEEATLGSYKGLRYLVSPSFLPDCFNPDVKLQKQIEYKQKTEDGEATRKVSSPPSVEPVVVQRQEDQVPKEIPVKPHPNGYAEPTEKKTAVTFLKATISTHRPLSQQGELQKEVERLQGVVSL